MPCHGDKGQGLTEEFRQLYPVEEQNCWDSGCHGARPYEDGWTLPSTVPALVGPGELSNFESEAALYGYIRATMPFHDPSTLEDGIYQRITAFLIRQNGHMVSPGAQDVPAVADEYSGSNMLYLTLAFILIAAFLARIVLRRFLQIKLFLS
jgi:hypothetical protein